MKTPLILAAAVLGAAASPALAQGSEPYRALGTEPFWSLTIGGGRMTYESAEGRQISVRTPRATTTRQGRVYRSPRLTMTVVRGQECSDGMSDQRYRDTVRVRVDGRNLDGCGGGTIAPATLAGTSWSIIAIDGAPVSGDRYRMAFEANRLSGRAGCNSFGGSYRVGRDGFQAGPLTMTRMACPGPVMAHERAVSRILSGRVRLFYPDGRTLVMRGENGGEIRLRRSI